MIGTALEPLDWPALILAKFRGYGRRTAIFGGFYERYTRSLYDTLGLWWLKDQGAKLRTTLSRLLKERFIFLNGPVHDGMSSNRCTGFHFEAEPLQRNLCISIARRVVDYGLSSTTDAVYQPKYRRLVIGQAASMGSVVVAAGEKGMRFSLAKQLWSTSVGRYQGQATEL